MRRLSALAIVIASLSMAAAQPGHAAECGNSAGGFNRWVDRFAEDAARAGVSSRAIDDALAGVSYDQNVIRLDRNQHSFKLSFEQFYARRVGGALLAKGRRLMAQHRRLLDRIEDRFGVPREIVIAIWGLETNYGADGGGGKSIVRSLATLAYDCRRSEFFRGQLLDALRIIDAGDMSVSQLRGGWAGEIGQTQFLPTPYVKYAVDFDGDGHRDLIHSVPDVLASTANFLKAHGWRAGGSWEPGSANYAVIRDWNRAEVYQRTISKMADVLSRG